MRTSPYAWLDARSTFPHQRFRLPPLKAKCPTAQILPQMCQASRASRSGRAVGILRVLCNGMCTAQRFHMEGEEQRCSAMSS